MNSSPTRPENNSELVDKPALPISNRLDKAKSLLNVLRGYEEFTLNTAGVIISSNLEAVSITGYEEWEVIGKSFSMFYTDEEQTSGLFEADLKECQDNGKLTIEGWKLKKRKAQFWSKIKFTTIYDNLHNLTGYKVILRDATHKAFHDFKVGQKRNEYFYNYSSIGLIEFSLNDGRIVLLNQFASDLFGAVGEYVYLYEVFKDRYKYHELLAVIENDRHVNNFEFQLINNTWVSIDCKFYLKKGVVEGLMTDISSRKAHEEKVMMLSKNLDTFIYHASHDLRSPLTSMLGLLNLIQVETNPEVVRTYSGMITDRVKHLDNLLRELTAVAYNNSTELDYSTVNVKSEIEQIINDSGSHTDLEVRLQVKDGLQLITDVKRFRTIIRQILSNSIKFRNTDLQKSVIKINIDETENNVRIIVNDNGIGVKKDLIEKIIQPFFKGNDTHAGNGLGLFITKSMVDKLGGKLTVFSIPDVGTTVTVLLPRTHTNR